MTASGPTSSSPPLAPPDTALVANAVQQHLPFSATFSSMVPLAGDASNRRYFRVHLSDGPQQSLILMQLAAPEAFKASEEAVSDQSIDIDELPFTNVLRHLHAAGTPVPQLYFYDQQGGLLYLEDFGDVTLSEASRSRSEDAYWQLYHHAVKILAGIHTYATSPENPRCLAFRRRFDIPLLMWEFDHFLEYGIEARIGKVINITDREVIRSEFHKIAQVMTSQPLVFTHRDYHSRNLMVHGDQLGVIDFQDALLGPGTYDLASLLRDAYVELEEQRVDELIQLYVTYVSKQTPLALTPSEFRHLFDLTSIQRNLKAAGRFVYIDQVKKNPKFLQDIPRTLGYVRSNLAKYSQLDTLRKHLAPYVPELR